MKDKTKLGKYEILEELGRGGFGVVYMAKDSVLQRSVAVKALHPALLVDPQFIERFKNEARIAALLDHPNLVPVYDFGQEDGQFYLVMAYMPGGSLSKRLKASAPFPTGQVIQTIREIGAGLAYAHDHKIIHRDLKPSNILFDDKGIARVSDMGFAKLVRESSAASLTASGQQVGTPSYMAPEIWKGKPATIASDIYSLACICIEMFTGKPYFDGETTPEIMLKHFQPREIPAEIPPGLRSALTKALAEKPEERYASIPEFLAGLEQVDAKREGYHLGFEGAQARQREQRPPEPPSRAPSQAETNGKQKPGSADEKKDKRKWVVGAVIGALLLMLGILSLSLIGTAIKKAAAPIPTDTPQAARIDDPAMTEAPIKTSTPTITATPQPTLGIGSIMTRETDGMEMVYVPAGEFIMGVPDTNSERVENTNSFWIDRTEVTVLMYKKCVESGECEFSNEFTKSTLFSKDSYPMTYVTWDQANNYCTWAGGRLPTEKEWEKAARGPYGNLYPWGNVPASDKATQMSIVEFESQLKPTGSFSENISFYGVFDMAGNASEWVDDWMNINRNIKVVKGGGEYYCIWPDKNERWDSYFCNFFVANNSLPLQLFAERNRISGILGFRCVVDP